jgi:hypothetical protein
LADFALRRMGTSMAFRRRAAATLAIDRRDVLACGNCPRTISTISW